jgi:hypothetical protein
MKGDKIHTIAKQLGSSFWALLKNNSLTNAMDLQSEQILKAPRKKD